MTESSAVAIEQPDVIDTTDEESRRDIDDVLERAYLDRLEKETEERQKSEKMEAHFSDGKEIISQHFDGVKVQDLHVTKFTIERVGDRLITQYEDGTRNESYQKADGTWYCQLANGQEIPLAGEKNPLELLQSLEAQPDIQVDAKGGSVLQLVKREDQGGREIYYLESRNYEVAEPTSFVDDAPVPLTIEDVKALGFTPVAQEVATIAAVENKAVPITLQRLDTQESLLPLFPETVEVIYATHTEPTPFTQVIQEIAAAEPGSEVVIKGAPAPDQPLASQDVIVIKVEAHGEVQLNFLQAPPAPKSVTERMNEHWASPGLTREKSNDNYVREIKIDGDRETPSLAMTETTNDQVKEDTINRPLEKEARECISPVSEVSPRELQPSTVVTPEYSPAENNVKAIANLLPTPTPEHNTEPAMAFEVSSAPIAPTWPISFREVLARQEERPLFTSTISTSEIISAQQEGANVISAPARTFVEEPVEAVFMTPDTVIAAHEVPQKVGEVTSDTVVEHQASNREDDLAIPELVTADTATIPLTAAENTVEENQVATSAPDIVIEGAQILTGVPDVIPISVPLDTQVTTEAVPILLHEELTEDRVKPPLTTVENTDIVSSVAFRPSVSTLPLQRPTESLPATSQQVGSSAVVSEDESDQTSAPSLSRVPTSAVENVAAVA